jgi:predicted MPP superfamily phosphohydrolase
MAYVLLALGAVGHVVFWAALVNRIHALGIKRLWVDLLTLMCGVCLALLPPVVFTGLAAVFWPSLTLPLRLPSAAAWTYIGLCAMFCVIAAVQRLFWRRHPERRGIVLSNHTVSRCVTDVSNQQLTAPGIPTWLNRLPGNEVLRVCVEEKQLAIPQLPSTHEGLRIAHLSDLHMSGRLTKSYFEQVVAATNDCRPDLVAITGDLVERSHCLSWIPDTLGKLQAPGGVFYVLGNHDQHVDENQLKRALADAGLVHLGGKCIERTVGQLPLLLAGNELPWYKPAATFSDWSGRGSSGLPLRLALVHSPDQFGWAQANDVDLVLAGHLHGGQVRLPLLGAIMSPSLQGVRYAGGVYKAGNTVMHVSRGTGSLTPLRFRCPPEIAILILRSGRVAHEV